MTWLTAGFAIVILVIVLLLAALGCVVLMAVFLPEDDG